MKQCKGDEKDAFSHDVENGLKDFIRGDLLSKSVKKRKKRKRVKRRHVEAYPNF